VDALPEVFELAFELIDFHCRSLIAKRYLAILAHGIRCRQNVVHEKLQAVLALVLVYVESVNELYGAFRGHEGAGLFNVIEGNCIERTPRSWDLDPHFQVAIAHYASIADGKHTVKAGLGKCLPPRTAGAQRLRGLQSNFLH